MYYIFASSTKKDLTPINEIKTEDIGYAIPSGYKVTSEYHYKYRQKTRIFDCYIIDESKSGKIEPNQTKEQVSFFHGYLLEPFNSAEDLAPDQNYYGVYSHGKIKNDDCYFATDEIGLSPLYYSKEDEIILISNNPHLIALYKRYLGYKIRVEPTIAVWQTIGITSESHHTGYQGIYRVNPWRYIIVNFEDNVSFLSKKITGEGLNYNELLFESIKQLRAGMRIINTSYSKKYSQLTGGFDSRMVLAYILDSGAIDDYQFITKGLEQNPDCIVAKMIAEKFKLNHICSPRRTKKEERIEMDETIKKICKDNAMESSLVRLQEFMGIGNNEVVLNGMGAVFAKSLGFAKSFSIFMKRKFSNTEIDFGNLTYEERRYGNECFGFADIDRMFYHQWAQT